MLGRISGLKPHGYDKKGMQRWIIEISEYALSTIPRHGASGATPSNTPRLKSSASTLKKVKFKAMPTPTKVLTPPPPPDRTKTGGLTIAEAKAGLALQFGVPPEAIEILIKG